MSIQFCRCLKKRSVLLRHQVITTFKIRAQAADVINAAQIAIQDGTNAQLFLQLRRKLGFKNITPTKKQSNSDQLMNQIKDLIKISIADLDRERPGLSPPRSERFGQKLGRTSFWPTGVPRCRQGSLRLH